MDKTCLIKNFSRSAPFYDRYADVQKKTALELLGRLGSLSFNKILELGCGTGSYCTLLCENFPYAQLTAVDISESMIAVAANKPGNSRVEFIVADAEDISLKEGFDLITSNACFQWFSDLESSLIRYKKMLHTGGEVLFSLFGPQTFRELNASLGDLFENVSVSAAGFLNKEGIEEILKNHFTEVCVEEKFYKEEFPLLSGLLEKIKYTGTMGAGFEKKAFLGPKALKKLEAVYLERFNRITATYQVFFCQGRKK